MGQLQITQVKRRLLETVTPYIDLSDLGAHGHTQTEHASLSRSLAAFVAMKLTGLSAEEAAASVTDGAGDNGIDAVAIVAEEARIVLVQSKWPVDGKGSASLSEMVKLREGLDDLVGFRWERFNDRLRDRTEDLENLLLEPHVSIDVVFAHMGTGALASEVNGRMKEYIDDLNDPTEVARFHYLSQADIHRLLVDEQQSPKINLVVEVSDWGMVEGPPVAVYGQVKGSEVAAWFQRYGRALLEQNVRVVLQDSEVNNSLLATLSTDSNAFWYYNNGITVLCDSITKSPAGGSDRRLGTFGFDGVSVVNGAQTVGALARYFGQNPEDAVGQARVMVRFISLAGASADFARDVTRATNTQNRIGGRDFLSLDPQQARLRDEFAVEGLEYVYRSGETDPDHDKGCTVLEATIALACSSAGVSLSTQAKREISRLWDDTSKPPYTQLFNPRTNYLRIWRAVGVLRFVDNILAELSKSFDGKGRGAAVHGNRFILHLIFMQLAIDKIDDPEYDWIGSLKNLPMLTMNTAFEVALQLETEFTGYPASLFKNVSKTTKLSVATLEALAARRALTEGG
jgi:drug/metabolite transporter superfamily protein YnfA